MSTARQNLDVRGVKRAHTFVAAALSVAMAVVTAEVGGVTLKLDRVRQRYPWNGLVDIDYTVACEDGVALSLDDALEVTMVDKSVIPAVTNRAYTFLQAPLPLTAGRHRITWNANADGVRTRTNKAEFLLEIAHYAEEYMVIDVSDGPSASVYPTTFVNHPPEGGFNVSDYKGNKIVLRRIRPGSYVAGSPYDEAMRRTSDDREVQHRVTISKPFYIGIFEVTQLQYKNVMDKTPSLISGNFNPVERVSYQSIRGGNWPNSVEPAANSFVKRLSMRCKSWNAKTERYDVPVEGFDLPTEYQWEYACRAGTVGAYGTTNEYANTQDGLIGQMNRLGRYKDNSGNKHAAVGTYEPNPWGLYDMHGNVWERCRDWYQLDVRSLKQYVDPQGPDSAVDSKRTVRGASYGDSYDNCRSASRGSDTETNESNYFGFRLSRDIP